MNNGVSDVDYILPILNKFWWKEIIQESLLIYGGKYTNIIKLRYLRGEAKDEDILIVLNCVKEHLKVHVDLINNMQKYLGIKESNK